MTPFDGDRVLNMKTDRAVAGNGVLGGAQSIQQKTACPCSLGPVHRLPKGLSHASGMRREEGISHAHAGVELSFKCL